MSPSTYCTTTLQRRKFIFRESFQGEKENPTPKVYIPRSEIRFICKTTLHKAGRGYFFCSYIVGGLICVTTLDQTKIIEIWNLICTLPIILSNFFLFFIPKSLFPYYFSVALFNFDQFLTSHKRSLVIV